MIFAKSFKTPDLLSHSQHLLHHLVVDQLLLRAYFAGDLLVALVTAING